MQESFSGLDMPKGSFSEPLPRIKLDISIDLMQYNFFQKNNHLGIISTNLVN